MANPHLSVDLDELSSMFTTLAKETRSFQFKNAVAECQRILTALPGMKTSLKVFRNTLISVEEGLNDKVISKASAKLDLETALADLTENYQAMVRDLSVDKPSLDEDLYSHIGKDTLRVYDKNMDQVQRTVAKAGVFTGYVPILPLTGPPLDASKLVRLGIPADSYGGYTILKKQFVAGISYDYLRAYAPADAGQTVLKKAKTNKAETNEKLLNEFREIVQTKFKHLHLTELAEPHQWWGAVWLWFVSSKELEVWKKCTINPTTVSTLKVRKWSFPFANRG